MKLKTWVYPANWHWVASYYGKKDKEQKAEIIQAFKEGEKKIIVATKAFGMGWISAILTVCIMWLHPAPLSIIFRRLAVLP
mgnify:CR=1 FL=1